MADDPPDNDLPGFSDAEVAEQIAPYLAEVDRDFAAQRERLVQVFREKGPEEPAA